MDERKKVNDPWILDRFLNNNDPRNFPRAVTCLLGENSPPQWRLQQMYPDCSHQESAERIAEYFNSISQEYQPLQADEIPCTFDRHLDLLMCQSVAKKAERQ